ncbi:MAG: tyrosine-type recombinase/integrase [Rubrobacter sp.]|nr:tyrosine-type recombinase/integrase [Rubrobacter sp.]
MVEKSGKTSLEREAAIEEGLEHRLEASARRARHYFDSARAPNTVKAYKSDLTDFETWAKVDAGGISTLPASPETVAVYIGELAGRGLKAATINRRLTAISVMHKAARVESPTEDQRVRDVLKGIRREHGSYQQGAAALLTSTIRRMILAMPDDTDKEQKASARDAALLLVGYAGAFRRSELASLRVKDVEFTEEGLTILLRRSKTDQEGRGLRKGLPYGSNRQTCPVRSLKAWLEVLGREEGALFCRIDRYGNIGDGISDRAICDVVKKRARNAGLDPARYSGHSLRAGLATEAAAAGVPEKSIMRQGDWKNIATVMRYVREGTLFENNAAASVGL